MKKYFNFKGTVNGNEYFLRPFLALIGMLILIALGIATPHITNVSDAGIALFILLVIPFYIGAAWLGLSTTNKRINAFWDGNYKIAAWIVLFVPYLGTALSLYLWFANGTYPNGHKDE